MAMTSNQRLISALEHNGSCSTEELNMSKLF